MNRRNFAQIVGAAALSGRRIQGATPSVAVVSKSDAPPVRWAVQELQDALKSRGVEVATSGGLVIRAEISGSAREQLQIQRSSNGIDVSAGDARGLTYGLLELADRTRLAADPLAALQAVRNVREQPATRIRSITRLFTSDVHDKPWFNDREMWPQYLSMLATHRFNRFNLSFGIGYDFLQNVTDAYFLFTYPFLLAVPGYNVRVPQLPDSERDHNLEMLKYISEQTVARGMEFQLGLWMHGYKWLNSPHPNYTVEGLNSDNHGPYCRDAVRTLLKACPAISGVTFRIHGESGVEEGNFDFWKTIFDGVATCGRKVEIDMHAKGMNQGMIDAAVESGMPVKISPKYWAEHMGMPYNQAEIREQERPKAGKEGNALMRYSAGSRSFLRYGYGDLLREDRKWGVLTRIWPGTQRLLLWGDPMTAAAHAKAFSFCGSDGVEICEPLSFKGRRGSGLKGDRCGYRDASLQTRWDWQKYKYTYRVWGRLLYNPECEPDVWQRALRKDFGANAPAVETALANASRILPIITTAHCPSAANNVYWPEVYTNQSIVSVGKDEPYTDTFSPKVFGNAGALDPQLFARVNDYADELLVGKRDGKYSPIEVAQWLEGYAKTASDSLAKAGDKAGNNVKRPEFRRMAIDVEIQAGLGIFFGAKFRSAVLYRIYEKTGDLNALEQALTQYRRARAAWADMAQGPGRAYVPDITVGEHPQLRGNWADRLPAIDRDIENMTAKLGDAKPARSKPRVQAAIREALGSSPRPLVDCRHQPPDHFKPGQPLTIEAASPGILKLYYRHVDQAERWESVEMEARDDRHRATIPAAYTSSPYPLQYYFEATRDKVIGLHPGFNAQLNNQPYFIVRANV
jgi:hypothetical protein